MGTGDDVKEVSRSPTWMANTRVRHEMSSDVITNRRQCATNKSVSKRDILRGC